ncbi:MULTISPECIES: SIR2 family protein [Agrobacterium]|uniref:SIR2 family protein n=1 Tax=Agrobacterium TaxID=357 RepID=UPI002301505E|nr:MULTISPECIES: SIR2 family protein [Agrobacterium]MDA5630853.1 SIR2 family protein [Agrobacterium sp. ST15.16.055]MDA6981674.1 SIR2 family protein [Agrobacterium salinitolerans]
MKFLKGSRNEFEKLKPDSTWDDRAEIVRRHMAEAFGSKNLAFLMGSGCSSLQIGGVEFGIPTMGPLAKEFQTLLAEEPVDGGNGQFVNTALKTRLYDELGIDLTNDSLKGNLEQMMAVLINAHQFCKTSDKEELSAVAPLVDDIIVGIKKFVLHKCTTGVFSIGDESVVALYRRFYQSLATRARGLAPPWVFSTNYDLFNERAMDRSGIPYSNGFSGTVERRFNPATYRLALAEQLDITSRRWAAVDGFVHFCKLHGSVNWIEENTGLYPIRESHAPLDPSRDRVMIYPTPSKQTASFGSPYSDMFREFQRQVVQDQSVLVILGFSFGDEHVNNIIFQGLTLPGFRLVAFMDPETNDITRELAALGDPRIWFIWGDGKEAGKKAHYFDDVVNHLMPTGADQKIDQAIEKALRTLLAKQQDTDDGQG